MTPWIRDWVEALESGYFKQGMNPNNLWEPEGRFTALGVLCEINGCKRVAVDQDKVKTNIRELATSSQYKAVMGNFASVVELEKAIRIHIANKTMYYYTYNDDKRIHEGLDNIPISLTAKLDCNACVDLLHIHRNNMDLVIEHRKERVSIAALDRALVPFPVIAEFIRDVWPTLTFSNREYLRIIEPGYHTFDLTRTDYGYFKLESV